MVGHLNAPRIVVDQSGAKRWRWLAEPFGTTAPETNPDGLGAFTQNLRFPGQYADAESGLSYNYFRNYDSSVGAYTQSDPLGLIGGVNTYSYVGGGPLTGTDPQGLLNSQAITQTTKYLIGGGGGLVEAAPTLGAGAMIGGGLVGFGVGVGVGLGINEVWENTTGQSPGGSLYDWFHPDPIVASPIPTPTPNVPAISFKDSMHDAYSRICSAPPPPNLDKCENMRWQIRKLRMCITGRKLWEGNWGPGRGHDDQIRQKEKELEKWERRLKNAWDCKKDCP